MTSIAVDPSTAANSLGRNGSASPEYQHHQHQKVVFLPQQQESSSLSPMSPHQYQSEPHRQLIMASSADHHNRQQSVSFPRASNSMSPPIHHNQTVSNNNNNNNPALQELQTNLVMQDKIIETLESDNNRLIQENKGLRQKLKETEEKANIAMALSHPGHHSTASSGPRASSSTASPSSAPPPTAAISAETAITIASLKEELARQREEVDSERRDMTRKISWYIDRQEVSAAQDALIAEQQQQIRDLRLQAADLEAQVMTLGGGSKPLASASDKDRQIRLLNRRVAELEDVARTRNPDSLTELIRATRPPLSEAAEFKKMKAQLDEANRRLEDQEQSAQRALSQLRVDSDNLRAQYAKRLEKVEEEMKLRLAATQTRRTKQAEKQSDEIRAYYNKKLKELETEVAAYRRGDHQKSSSASASNNNGVVVSPHFSLPTSNFTNAASETQQQKKARAASASVSSRSNSNKNSNNQDENNNNQSQQQQQQQPQMIMTPFGPLPMNANTMMNLMGGNNNPNLMSMMMMNGMNGMNNNQQQQQSMPMMVPVMDPSMQQRIWFLETRVKTLEEENRFLQKQASESVLSTGAAAAIQSQLGESQREVIALQRLLREAQEQQRKTLQELEDRLHAEREAHGKEVERMTAHHRDDMKALQTRCDAEIRLRSDSVTSRQLMAFSSGLSNVLGTDLGANASTKELRRYLLLLAERVHALERQLAAAESEHHRQLSELKRVSEFEFEVEKQRMGIALKQKNTEIDSFKVQLDGMLHQIAKMRR